MHDEGEGGANIFADAAAGDPLNLSDVGKTFLGGMIEHGPSLTAIGCTVLEFEQDLAAAPPAIGSSHTCWHTSHVCWRTSYVCWLAAIKREIR
jgi:hypothetical protein